MLQVELSAISETYDDDYVRMINTDRIWEYHIYSVDYKTDNICRVLFRMKFDGNEMRNGKLYSVFKFCDDEISWSLNRSNGEYNDDLSMSPNTHTDRFLIREEDHRILLYNDLTVNYNSNAFLGNEEIILYDFNLNLHAKCLAMTLVYDYIHSYIFGSEDLLKHEIIGLDSMIVDGKVCAVQYISDAPSGIFAIEGIGAVDYGILPIYNLICYVTGYQGNCKLNKVYNKDGEVIFQNPESCWEIPASVDSLSYDIYFSYFNDNLEVKDTGNMISAKIYNLNGEVVMAADGYDRVLMDTKELNSGVYIAKAGFKTLKIVVR